MSTRTTLGEILPVSYGKARTENYGEVRQETPVYGSSGNIGTFNRALTTGPALIVGRKGSAGAVFYASEPCWPIDTVYFSEGNARTYLPYFRYLLESLTLGKLDRSTAIPSLSRDDYNSIQVDIPSVDEQHRIVAEIEEQLSRLEAGVAALKRVQVNLKRYTSSVIASTFPRVGKTLPSGWTWSNLSDLGELSRGKSKHRPRDDPKLYGGPYPFIQTGDVKASRGRIRKFTQTYSEMGLTQSRLWPAGTLCITIAANIADTGILEFDSCFPDSVVGFRADSGLALTQYIEHYLRSMKEHLDRLAPATAQKNINLEVLSKVRVPVPPPSIAKGMVDEVDRRLSVVEELEAQVRTDFVRAERLKQSILQQAFSATPSSMSRN